MGASGGNSWMTGSADGARSLSPAPRHGRVIAVTGASSFLGTNLIGLLEEDVSVRRIVAVDVEAPSSAEKKTRYYEVDFTQPTAEARLAEILTAEGVDTVVHLAFLASPSHRSALAHELESVGTRHVLVAASHARVRKLVMWSQTLLYGAHGTNPNHLTERHPLRADRAEPFFADKLEAEAEVARFADRHPGSAVTVLRMAPILGPTVSNVVTRYLAHRFVATMMGFDPLVQFLHEVDAIAALKLAVDHDHRGIFNVASDGVLRLSTAITLAGRLAVPVPHPLARRVASALWVAHVGSAPAAFTPYLRFVCVADTTKARTEMGFRPSYTAREAVLDFTNVQKLRDVKLLQETAA